MNHFTYDYGFELVLNRPRNWELTRLIVVIVFVTMADQYGSIRDLWVEMMDAGVRAVLEQ